MLQKDLFNKVYFTANKTLINELLKPKILNFLEYSRTLSENSDNEKMRDLTYSNEIQTTKVKCPEGPGL